MVDPKKEYELLMRYLQGDALKREPAAIPEKAFPDDWQPTPQTEQPATSQPPALDKNPRPSPERFISGKPFVYWPKWKLASLRKRLRLLVALLAVLVLVIAFWKMYAFFTLSPDSLYHQLYLPLSLGAQEPKAKNSIEQYYATGNYVAVGLQSKKQSPLTEREKLLTGLSYLQRDDYAAAIKWLEPAANNFKSPYRQQAEFYLALTYLKNEDYDRCIERMEHIAYTPSHPFHAQVSENIISDIKMLKWK